MIISLGSSAQTAPEPMGKIEKEIRELDQQAAKAILQKDEKLITRFFTKDSIVNNPRNNQTFGSAGIIDAAKTAIIDYYSFDRKIDSVQIYNDTAIAMGHETVVLKDRTGAAGETIQRRYTNVWMKTGRNWQIVARHASIICR